MVKRRGLNTAAPAGEADYAVGYGRPPTRSRFKPGQSGNPAGRPKGLRNFKTDVLTTLAMPLNVKEGGRLRPQSTQAAFLLMLRQKACQGDQRAIDRLCELAQRYNPDVGESGADPTLSTDDEALWEALKAEILAEAEATSSTVVEGPKDLPLIVRRRTK